MICYECSEKATVTYERHVGNGVVEVEGYCEEHDPYPDAPEGQPFDPQEHEPTEEDR